MKGFMGIIMAGITVVVLVVIVANVVMPTLKETNTDTWSDSETNIWTTLGIFVILGVLVTIAFLFIMGAAKGQ